MRIRHRTDTEGRQRMLRLRAATAIVAVAIAGLTMAVPVSADPPLPQKSHFDLQAHRGGLGLTTESTLAGFAKAIELGVTTLELDTQVTQDEHVVVTHDRRVSAVKCQDTAPAFPGDPEFPYVGDFITNLTLAQVKTVECGYQALPDHPGQDVVS